MHDYSKKSDAEVVALTLEDQEVFLYLMERYEAKLFRYIRRFMYFGKETAEDILQEVFIKVYKNLNNFDPDLNFSSWVYRIAHNETINYLKKNEKHKTIPLETDDEEVVNLIDILESDIDVVRDVKQQELQDKVRKILQMLSPAFREILVLRYLDEKGYKEISDILKKPMGTVATLVNRAKKQFKQIAEKNNLIYSLP